MPVLANSSYLDFTSYGSTAGLPDDGKTPDASSFPSIKVGLVLERANQPTFLDQNWATRQATINQLATSNTLWSTYGASSADYGSVTDYLKKQGLPILGDPNGKDGYVTSLDSRTVWVNITSAEQWKTLFGTDLLHSTKQDTLFWKGNLTVPSDLGSVQGLFFDSGTFNRLLPDPGSGSAVTLPDGPQSIGNSAGAAHAVPNPQDIAAAYHFPLSGDQIATGPIGLIEPGLGDALPKDSKSFQTLLDDYRNKIGVQGPVSVIGVQKGGTSESTSGERSLDVSIATAVDPQSTLVLYAGSGAKSSTLAAYHSAVWDTANNPAVVSSSWVPGFTPAPGSPFVWASQQLFVDAALRNMTMLTANGDGGSSYKVGDGVPNVATTETSAFEIMVGGTSIAPESVAAQDPTLNQIVARALAADPATLWQLVQGGMTLMPTADSQSWLVETVWNEYVLGGNTFDVDRGYLENNTSTGGVDPTQPVPSYQSDSGSIRRVPIRAIWSDAERPTCRLSRAATCSTTS
jgi:hypothetical protein